MPAILSLHTVADTDQDTDSYPGGNRYTHSSGYAEPDADVDGHRNRERHADSAADEHGNRDANGTTNSDTYRNRDASSGSHGYADRKRVGGLVTQPNSHAAVHRRLQRHAQRDGK